MEKSVETRFVSTPVDLEMMSSELVSAKNRYLHRGGSPRFNCCLAKTPDFHTTCCPMTLRTG